MTHYTAQLLSFLLILGLFSCQKKSDEPTKEHKTSTEEAFLLRLSPQKGKEYNYKINLELTSKAEQKNIRSNSSIYFDLTAQETNDSLSSFEAKLSRMLVSTEMEGITVTFDSSKENEGMGALIGASIKPMLEKPIQLEVNNEGNITSLDWEEKNNETISLDFSGITLPLPKEKVRIGDSWQAFRKLQNLADLNITMTLKEITKEGIFIDLNGASEENKIKLTGHYQLDPLSKLATKGEITVNAVEKGTPLEVKLDYTAL